MECALAINLGIIKTGQLEPSTVYFVKDLDAWVMSFLCFLLLTVMSMVAIRHTIRHGKPFSTQCHSTGKVMPFSQEKQAKATTPHMTAACLHSCYLQSILNFFRIDHAPSSVQKWF